MLLTGPFAMLSMPSFDFHLPPCTEDFHIHLSPLWQLPLFPSMAQFPCVSHMLRCNGLFSSNKNANVYFLLFTLNSKSENARRTIQDVGAESREWPYALPPTKTDKETRNALPHNTNILCFFVIVTNREVTGKFFWGGKVIFPEFSRREMLFPGWKFPFLVDLKQILVVLKKKKNKHTKKQTNKRKQKNKNKNKNKQTNKQKQKQTNKQTKTKKKSLLIL